MNRKIDALDEIFELRATNPPIGLEEYMQSMNNKIIILYGAGAFGKENLSLFRDYGVEPYAFLDRNARPDMQIMGLPVYHPDDRHITTEIRESAQVYISITLPKRIMTEIQKDLKKWGYQHISPVQIITAHQVRFDDTEEENPGDEYFSNRSERIESVLRMMGDKESRDTFLSCVKGHMLRDYSSCIETDYPCQYFEAGVPLKKGFERFVDCGAYNGDSLSAILNYCKMLNCYIAFEPILDNFHMLSETVDKNKENIENAFLFPCGVSDHTGVEKFSIEASSSSLDENGEPLPIIRIDDAIKKAPVSFLKMDIEGSEPMALRGAEKLIRQHKPDLAISVYHSANHFWDIPYMIHEMVPEYRFFLRAHTPASLESVLYCTTEEE